ncbi:MAG: NADH-quinone oxidoreductase subunit J, partial [Desulfobulbus sp.]
MIVFSGILAISLRNPVHCVLMVLVLFFHMAGLYLTLNAEFLA